MALVGEHGTYISSNALRQPPYDAVRADELDCRENGKVDAGEQEYEHRPEKGQLFRILI